MPRSFQAQLARLKLLAAVAAWEVDVMDLRARLAELTVALRDALDPNVEAVPSTARLIGGLIEARQALKCDLHTLEGMLADAQAMLATEDAP